jgi:CO/xanthine dehydrogenase FAD-binding subunit
MKSAPFEYIRPHSVDEVCALLAGDADATIIAGGQTLVPMMAMRLARPSRLVDIARIPDLHGIRDDGAAIAIGATTRQAEAEASAVVARRVPLLANADPAAEIPLVLVTLGGDIVLRDPAGARTIAAKDFFVGPMMTAMNAGSCVTEIRFPVWNDRRIGVGFQEISARRSDFALASAAAQVAFDEAGRCRACAVGVGGATAVPMRLQTEALIGSILSDAEIDAAVRDATDTLEIMTSPHASDGYRCRASRVLAARALAEARDHAFGLTAAP